MWHKAHQLTLAAYKSTAGYPRDEVYGLMSQTRRASASISANITEGCARATDADFERFLQNAISSASELEYHFLVEHDLGYLNDWSLANRSFSTRYGGQAPLRAAISGVESAICQSPVNDSDYQTLDAQVVEVKKMLSAFIQKLRATG